MQILQCPIGLSTCHFYSEFTIEDIMSVAHTLCRVGCGKWKEVNRKWKRVNDIMSM